MRGLYIHIPFCEGKCAYCDFLSFPGRHVEAKSRYLKALQKEMRLRLKGQWQKVDTIFIGGGTPTSLTSSELASLFDTIHSCVDMGTVQEFTVEANPGTVDTEKLKLMKAAGVNRLSFGVQSFDDGLLKMLGRLHSASQADVAVQLARDAGFTNINLDLMYGLPGQTEGQWRQTLAHALDLSPAHLSLYQLIVEDGTRIARQLAVGTVLPIDEDGAADWFEMQRDLLSEVGYQQYEISNYAREGFASKHNQIYWQLEDYLGLGLGATSWQRPLRASNTEHFDDYCRTLENGGLPEQQIERLSEDEQMSESVFMALRINRGLERKRFQALYGCDVTEVFSRAIDEGVNRSWLCLDDERLFMTDRGRALGNWVFELFI